MIKFANNTARRKTPEGEGASEQLREIDSLVSKAIHEVRAITADLRPAELDRLGLTKALRSMMTKIESASGLRVDFQFGDLDPHWTKEEEINIYRMAQEGINNALKHARAKTIRLEAVIRDRELQLIVEDDGVGLPGGDADLGEVRQGTGLSSLRERAKLLNGRMRIKSSPGNGTRLEFNIPIAS